MFSPGWVEMMILGFIALLLFGKRLPEVARSFGQSFMEFKRGMTAIETDVKSSVYSSPTPQASPEKKNRVEADLQPEAADKFEFNESEDSNPS